MQFIKGGKVVLSVAQTFLSAVSQAFLPAATTDFKIILNDNLYRLADRAIKD